jgi:hypothetical protein
MPLYVSGELKKQTEHGIRKNAQDDVVDELTDCIHFLIFGGVEAWSIKPNRQNIIAQKISVGIILVAVASCVSRVGEHAICLALGVAKRLTEAPVDLANVFDGVLGQRTIRGDGELPPLRIARG